MATSQNHSKNHSTDMKDSVDTCLGRSKPSTEIFETMNGICLPRATARGIYYAHSGVTEKYTENIPAVSPPTVMPPTPFLSTRSTPTSPTVSKHPIHSLPALPFSPTPTPSPPPTLQVSSNFSVTDQNHGQQTQSHQPQQLDLGAVVLFQTQIEQHGLCELVANNPMNVSENLRRLEVLEKAIKNFVSYGLCCDELLEWLQDSRSYNTAYEQPLMKCVEAIYLNSPAFGPWTGLKVLAIIQKNRLYLSRYAQDQIQTWYTSHLKKYNLYYIGQEHYHHHHHQQQQQQQEHCHYRYHHHYH